MAWTEYRNVTRAAARLAAVIGIGALSSFSFAEPGAGRQPAPIGVWRGTSTCTDRVAAPACHDEVVVYEFTAGARAGTVHWRAHKIVEGQRELMGEMDLAYDTEEGCWRAEFNSSRVHSVWCLAVDGAHMTGTGQLLPGKQTIRRINVRRD